MTISVYCAVFHCECAVCAPCLLPSVISGALFRLASFFRTVGAGADWISLVVDRMMTRL